MRNEGNSYSLPDALLTILRSSLERDATFRRALRDEIDEAERRIDIHPMTPAEAVYGVFAWLSMRKEALAVGAEHECGVLAEMAGEFCRVNGLGEPTSSWPESLTIPNEDEKEPD